MTAAAPRRRLAAAAAGLCAAATAAAPGTAAACAVCFTGANDASRIAFIGTTAFLTLLPLAVLGACCWWAWRRFQVLDREAELLRERRAAAHRSGP